ncbi:tRNA (adenosine(37)-N6)-threonylcarbamoyltransferase complex dimerization subunit type 1 TsaB [Fibrobacter sp.]|uniref:tRNA (adenosine(37)-N6)-threonylcarbamoyltransferase complex dimerization subunit type 1 TsaB n=1 Tax=Fibrobacter sp. TaxID=35828 RepID=UPI0026035D8F|nr:tRNA (adenosine(37)-N6)-threonylcarbamoyltransferase complex dimerization subunit type 1 TsaB [Fibrobacter sp.]MDD5942965.1 tRNA (adenosine(37)-N6)-threonylcarbamoyltransferase complex dimerization subunit type 1 TsaB [Fibrobacter sp.]
MFDLFVDTSRKGISMALLESGANRYIESIDESARGETASAMLDALLEKAGATLDQVTRVMVTLGPGSFSGLRTGVAFCEGLSFSGKRKLYGVSTLAALACFADASESAAVVIRARKDYWYLRLDEKESFIETAQVIEALKAHPVKAVVVDEAALADKSLQAAFNSTGTRTILDKGQPLSKWSKLFNTVAPSLMLEANYIQPSYFEKLH